MEEDAPARVLKAFAYITHGNRLLVFVHVDVPEAGIQVPAGTVDSGERPEDAVMREAFEETGLTNLELAGFLGIHEHDQTPYGKEGIAERHFFHLICDGEVPESWEHREEFPSEGDSRDLFRLYWVHVDRLPALIAEHDYFVPQLRQYLRNGR